MKERGEVRSFIKLERPLHHAIIPSHYLRPHGGAFASFALPFFRADQLTAILLSGLTIGLIVARLGDDDSRGQHDHEHQQDRSHIGLQEGSGFPLAPFPPRPVCING